MGLREPRGGPLRKPEEYRFHSGRWIPYPGALHCMTERGHAVGCGGLWAARCATSGQIHAGYTSLPSPAAGRECLLVWKLDAGARRSLDKDAASRQASFLFLGLFSSCARQICKSRRDCRLKTARSFLTKPRFIDGERLAGASRGGGGELFRARHCPQI